MYRLLILLLFLSLTQISNAKTITIQNDIKREASISKIFVDGRELPTEEIKKGDTKKIKKIDIQNDSHFEHSIKLDLKIKGPLPNIFSSKNIQLEYRAVSYTHLTAADE